MNKHILSCLLVLSSANASAGINWNGYINPVVSTCKENLIRGYTLALPYITMAYQRILKEGRKYPYASIGFGVAVVGYMVICHIKSPKAEPKWHFEARKALWRNYQTRTPQETLEAIRVYTALTGEKP